MRRGSINGAEDYDGIVCATCFMLIAEEKGMASLFRVTAERVNVELETVTPSGRVWDEESFRWSVSAGDQTPEKPPKGGSTS
jgi:hypothetical protein